jgi:hypothetical protein
MPYILLKRNDIPAGVLQTLDLQPNTSIGEEAYAPYSQTGYRIPPPRATVALLNNAGVITFESAREGLAAWFLTNVDDGSGATAFILFTIGPPNAAPGDSLGIDATPVGGPLVIFNFTATPLLSNDVLIGIDQDATTVNLIAAINNPVNGLLPFLAAVPGAAPNITRLNAAASGTAYNAMQIVPAGATFIPAVPTLFAGGADADALTAAEADQNVLDVLGLMNFGLGAAPAAMNLAAINGALTTGTIVAADVASILDILAGRQYYVPAGVQIETGSAFGVVPAVGTAGGPNWDVTKGFRRIYESGYLRNSFREGRLSQWSDAAYTLNGTTGAAVAVYNNDGTLYTGT